MPYIITTRRPDGCQSRVGYADDMRVTSRRAVATLEEARWESVRIIQKVTGHPEPYERLHDQFDAYERTADGWDRTITIGPLPDGAVIEVEREQA
jgi:hypothetical protein